MLAELTIYAADSVVSARLELDVDRVSDFLARSTPITLRHVRITSLEDGHQMVLDVLEIDRREILMAVADNARGMASRRVATVQRPATALVGPYRVLGRIHGPPSTDPIEVARRRAWIPMTSAIVEYAGNGMEVRIRHGAVLVNAQRLGSLVAQDDVLSPEPVTPAGPVAAAADQKKEAVPGPKDAWPTEQGTSSAWR
jgi:hypothetical protein